jgi:glycosyltransferase involved in cell wall biosynthesis
MTVEGNVTWHATPHRRRGRRDEQDLIAGPVFAHLRRRRYDVVHAFTPQTALAARLAGHRVLFTVLGAPSREWLAAQPRARLELFVAAAWSAARVTTLSDAAAQQVHWTTKRRPVVLAPGVRVDQFPVKDQRPPAPPRILFASDATARNKRVDLAIQAVSLLAVDHPGIVLQIGGPGDHRWALDALDAAGQPLDADASIEALGLGGAGDLPARYRDATVTVLPSRGEAFGLVLVESLASGTPVVCSDRDGPAQIVDEPRIGRVFQACDARDFARALGEAIALADDPLTAKECAAHAARWDWATIAGPAHEALYRKVARRS